MYLEEGGGEHYAVVVFFCRWTGRGCKNLPVFFLDVLCTMPITCRGLYMYPIDVLNSWMVGLEIIFFEIECSGMMLMQRY